MFLSKPWTSIANWLLEEKPASRIDKMVLIASGLALIFIGSLIW